MLIFLHRETLESPLINVSIAGRLVMGVIALSMRQCHPADEPAHSAIFHWRKNHVPVVVHPLVRDQMDRKLGQPSAMIRSNAA